MPGIDVAFHVVVVARGIVLHEAGRVEALCELVHLPDPFLGFGQVFSAGLQAPGLVEVDPGEDRRVVVVAFNLASQAPFPVFPGLRYRLSPEIRGVGHYQESELVRPVEFPRDFDLDVDAVAVESEILGEEDLVLHELVAREGVEAFRMVALVQAELEIDRFAVEGYIRILGTRQFLNADLALAEIGADFILLADPGLDFVQERVVEVPEVLAIQRDSE